MNRRTRLALLASVATLEVLDATGSPSIAADNQVILTPGTGVTMRSKDVGGGLQSPLNILGDPAGNTLYVTNANSGVATGTTNVPSVSYMFGWNGATWDQIKSTSGALNVSGTFFQGVQPVSGTVGATQAGAWSVTVTGSVGVGATQIGSWNIGTLTSITNPVTVQGTVSTSAVANQLVSGTLGATQAGTWNINTVTAVTSITNPVTVTGTVVATPSGNQLVSGTLGATQAGAPWTVTASGIQSNASSGIATDANNQEAVAYLYGWNGTTWDQLKSTGGVLQVTMPNIVTVTGTVSSAGVANQLVSGTLGATQAGSWSFSCISGCGGSVTVGSVGITQWAGGTLGAMANYGTSPGTVLVPGMNAFVTNVVSMSGTVGATQAGSWSFSCISGCGGSVTVGNVGITQWAGGTLGAMTTWGVSPGSILVPNMNASVLNWAGGTLGAMSNYGTSPGTVLVPSVNAFVTGAVGLSPGVASGTGASLTASAIMGNVTGSAPTYANNTLNYLSLDLSANLRTSVNNVVTVTGTVSTGGIGIQTVSGTVNVGNFPAIQVVSGTVTQGGAPWSVTVSGSVGVGASQVGTWNIGTLTSITNPVTVTGTVSSAGVANQLVSGTLGATQAGTWNINTLTSITNPVAVTQSTTPWTVSGTVTQGGAPWSVTVTGSVGVGATQIGTWNINALTSITNPVTVTGTVVATPSGNQLVSGTVGVTQATSPWVTSGTLGTTQAGAWSVSVTGSVGVGASQVGTWNIGTLTSITNSVGVTQSTSPWVVSGTLGASQAGSWSFTCISGCGGSVTVGNVGIATWANGTLGAMANYGTSPGAVLVPGMNAFITNTPSINIAQVTGSASSITNPLYVTGVGLANGTLFSNQTGSVIMGYATGTATTGLGQGSFNFINTTLAGAVRNDQYSWAGTALGAPSNYGTSPGAVEVPGVNAFITNLVTVTGTVSSAGVANQLVSGTLGATQAGSWSFTCISGCGGSVTVGNVGITTWAGGTLGAMSNFGISPGLVLVPGVNNMNFGRAQNSEQTPSGSAAAAPQASDLVGRPIIFPFANKENLVSGTLTTSGTVGTIILSAPGAGLFNYLTDLSCFTNGTGAVQTEVQFVNGTASNATVILDTIVNATGGFESHYTLPKGGVNYMSANTALVAVPKTSQPAGSTLICNAGGFKGT